MSKSMCSRRSYPTGPVRQSGMALVAGLLLLLVLTIISVSMFRSFGIQEKIAGNVREKQRALSAAISAQQFAENSLSLVTPAASGVCTGMVGSDVSQICSNLPADVSAVPWTNAGVNVGVTLTPFITNGNVVTGTGTPGSGTYFASPVYYISDLGSAIGGGGEIYQIDAAGWGGTPNSVAVVESTYLVAPAGWTPDI
jgi:type IV pilus assembly protein PilX